jgi:hypothetical protein
MPGMLGRILKVTALTSLPWGEAERLRKWLPKLHTPGVWDSIFVDSGASWSSGANSSVLPGVGRVVPEELDSEKLRQKYKVNKGYLQCGENPPVDAQSDRRKCPAQCPIMGENIGNGIHCDFHCVEATVEACTELNDKATVVDKERGICRPCSVSGCKTCNHDGTDTCEVCSAGFYLRDGQCDNPFWLCWYLFGGALLLIVMLVGMWMADLWMRPVTNAARLKHALELRSRAKLRQPKQADHTDVEETRPMWPLTVNLCRNGAVAGPGLALAFNFQIFIILWAVVMGIGWIYLGLSTSTDLFIMGTRPWDSPREQCLVIAWGYETQHELMWTKVAFLAFAYVFTFFGSILFSIRQLRIYQRMDLNTTTHKDFCAVASGLSGISGEERLEEELKEFFEKKTEKTVIGVSVSWVFDMCEDEIMAIIDEDMVLMHRFVEIHKSSRSTQEAVKEDMQAVGLESEDVYGHQPISLETPGVVKSPDDDDHLSTSRTNKSPHMTKELTDLQNESIKTKLMRSVESVFLSTQVQKALTRGRARGFEMRHKSRTGGGKDEKSRDANGDEHNNQVKQKLHGLQSSGKVFVVFNTEKDRNAAIEEWNSQDATFTEFRGKPVRLDEAEVEPEGAMWQNFTDENAPFGHKAKVAAGVVSVGFALCIWAGVFYLPFVWVSASASYSYGQSPSPLSQTVFGMIVVLGNVMMYSTCSEVSDRMRFTWKKDREVCYMIFYTISCMFNVLLDLVVTCFMAYWQLSGLGARMYGGQPITEAPTLISLLTTYGMQRELGENTVAYAWPATFLIPFLIEPLAAVFMPYMLMILLVRSHSDIHTAASEAYLASIPFDLSRYADIHLNVILAVLILFFPGGHNLTIFFGLAVAHVWIYVYDHVRVLRFCPGFTYASKDVDWWAQWMLAFPCALLLSIFTWKCNQDMEFKMSKMIFGPLGDPQESSIGILTMLVAAFLGHVWLHTWLLQTVVPMFGIKHECEGPEDTYRGCAERLPCSWFTSNPVHFLRSDYIYEHDPPITFCQQGKEHLLVKNEKVGQYFEDKIAQPEDAEGWTPSHLAESLGFHDVTRGLSISLTGLPAKTDAEGSASPPGSPISATSPRSPQRSRP